MSLRFYLLILSFASIMLLSACDGSSSSDSNATNNNSNQTNPEKNTGDEEKDDETEQPNTTQGERLTIEQGDVLPASLKEQGIKPLVDEQGRQLVLNGLNSGYGKHSYMRRFWEKPEDLRHEAVNLGYNAFRYLVYWDHIMPRKGEINQDYLDDVAERVEWLADEGFNVIIDMHQDNWGEQCGGNGAPDWASIGSTDPAPDAPWWIMAASPCVVDSSNAFFNNKDGVQDEFAKAWRAVAERLVDNPAIVGYDLMNEPTQIDAIADQMVHDMLDGATTGLLNFATLWTAWPPWSDDPENGFEGLLKEQIENLAANEGINVPESYVDKISKVLISRNKADWGNLNAVREFEGNMLTDMYQRVIDAVREVDEDTFIFVEPFSVSVNNGDATFIGKLNDPRGDKEDARLGYIPHMYPRDLDLTGSYLSGDFETLQKWQDNQKQFAIDNNMAWLVGEFGLSNAAEGGVKFLDDAILMMERNHLGWLNWESWPGDWGPIASDKRSDSTNAEALVNVFPRSVAGEIRHYHFDRQQGIFSLIYTKNSATGTTDISIPPRFAEQGFTVSSSNPDDSWSYEFDEDRHILHITHDPGSIHHKFTVELQDNPAIPFREIVNKRNGKCLDFRGVFPEEGAQIITWECGDDQTWQRWGYDSEAQSLRLLQNTAYCIDHGGKDNAKEKGKVTLQECNGSDDQRWVWEDDSLRNIYDNDIVLDDFEDGKENDTGDGATVGLWPYHGDLNQQWELGNY